MNEMKKKKCDEEEKLTRLIDARNFPIQVFLEDEIRVYFCCVKVGHLFSQ